MSDLAELRSKIDQIDQRLVQLLNERAELSRALGAFKRANGSAIYDPSRESEVIRRITAASSGPLSAEALGRIYTTIMSVSRELQAPLRVAYFGPAATFTHQAVIKHFGESATLIPAKTIADVFLMTEKQLADHGVVPVENSTEGMVSHTLDMFVDSELKICAEILLPITQNLMSKCALQEIRRIYSHPQGIAQTRDWLAQNLPGIELVETTSTARAAEIAAVEPYSAAIAAEVAAKEYGLEIVQARIEDNPANFTRFLVIGQRMATRTGNDKTAILFSVRDRVGALHDALEAFRGNQINLTKIESRPSKRKPWEYVFFVDLIGHPEDLGVRDALAKLSEVCHEVKILGAWPLQASA